MELPVLDKEVVIEQVALLLREEDLLGLVTGRRRQLVVGVALKSVQLELLLLVVQFWLEVRRDHSRNHL